MSSLFIVSPSGIEALVVHDKALAADDAQRIELLTQLRKRLQPMGSCLSWAPRANPLASHLLMLAANNPPRDFWRAVADAFAADFRVSVHYAEADEAQWERCEGFVAIDDTMFKASEVLRHFM